MDQKILVVDDEQSVTDLLAYYLHKAGDEVLPAAEGPSGAPLLDNLMVV